MNASAAADRDHRGALVALYDDAVGEVYAYLLRRCSSVSVAEELTSTTFMAAVTAVQRSQVEVVSVAWLIGIARHKLVDHWRRVEREERTLGLVSAPQSDDPWDAADDRVVARAALEAVPARHRAVLILRFVDGLRVPEIARLLGVSTGAAELRLVRAKAAFRLACDGDNRARRRSGTPGHRDGRESRGSRDDERSTKEAGE